MTLPVLFTAGTGAYNIQRSLRFRSSASAYLNRTLASSGSLRAWTWSAWVKRGTLGVQQDIFGWVDLAGGNFQQVIGFNSDNTLEFQMYNSALGGYVNRKTTSQVFRDPSAWYHIVVTWDSNNATADDRARIYINGTRVTAWANNTNPSLNQDSYINNSSYPLGIGRCMPSSSNYFDGYLTEVNFVNAQALTPSSFGQTNSATGVWQPIKYSGTYGTNGFYLNFSDNSNNTATTIGKDYSGNGNNWTPNNISVTSGSTYDSMTDVPTLTSATTANYCTLNPLRNTNSTLGTISNGNLRVAGTQGAINCLAAGTMTFSGKMYCEMTIEVRGNDTTGVGVGIVPTTNNQFQTAINMSTGIYYLVSGQKEVTGTNSAYGSSYTTGDVIGIAVDADAETVTFYKNNVSQGSISGTGIISAGVVPYIGFQDSGSPSIICNFGQQPFVYTPPTGFKALNTFNLSTPTIGATSSTVANKYFDATLYTGTGASLSVTNANSFQPDMVWIKCRSNARDNKLTDSVRGTTKGLISNTTGAETTDTNGLTAFNSNGFTIGSDAVYNTSTNTYVAWNWKANGAGSTNTAGSITSTVSANTTAGFSIVTYTGNNTLSTVGHGLGVSPAFIIVKDRSASNPWPTYHQSLGVQYYTLLNATDASYNNLANYWGSSAPTSTTFSINAYGGINTNGDNYVAYCFAQVAGYSAFGNYTGNGSTDGPFIFTGFRPKLIMIKRSDSTGNWVIQDSSRSLYNVSQANLYANLSNAEDTVTTNCDFLSNGFKFRGTENNTNASGGTYIYMAFAEFPQKFSLAR